MGYERKCELTQLAFEKEKVKHIEDEEILKLFKKKQEKYY